ncbi:MAG TPA: methyltransferase domain-containing protein [Thermoanaerobaculia bacterium]|nr:methyltransferase domain-containing protein [Thermoanaerobaculia bacterium]
MEHRLFREAAARYDLHTPPHHYQHDHRFVLEELSRLPSPARVLDVGCGTGVFLERARAAGLDALGLDAAPEMVAFAQERLGPEVVRLGRMQDLDEREAQDAIVSLCWSFNYCASLAEAGEILARFFRALRPGGLLILQTAHAANATGRLQEDSEPGPDGEPDDIRFLYRFTPEPGEEPRLIAQYVYACRSLNELVFEEHVLEAADVLRLGELARKAGFDEIRIYDNWRREPFSRSLSPFLLAVRPAR